MVALVSAVVLLLYLGRILGWIWGSKPLEPGDVVFLVPIVAVLLVISRRSVRRRLRPSTAVAEVDLSEDATRVPQLERSNDLSAGEVEDLKRAQEWAAADYHWWKR